MGIPAELSQVARTLTYTGSGLTAEVGIGTTVNISGGLEIKGVQVISAAGVWQGSSAGIQGAQGTTGTQGTTGIQGATGAQGTTGAQGATGSQGTTGTQGATGAQGATGSQGTLGTQGASGPSTTINATSDSTNAAQPLVFVSGTGSNQTARANSNLTYNPSTRTLTINGGTLISAHRYWRYVGGSAVNQHHPRVSRIILTNTQGQDTNIVTFTSDNCSDSGTIPSDGSTYSYDFGSAVSICKARCYSVINASRSANYRVEWSDNDSTWTQAFSGQASATVCGLFDCTGSICP